MNVRPKPMQPERSASPRCRTLLVHLVGLSGLLGTAVAAPPDLTSGGAPGDSVTIHLGPTGMRGWVHHVKANTDESRQILVKVVDSDSPADGILAVDDVILGADGSGADPVYFSADARKRLADAINDAEARNPAILKLIRWRAGTTDTVELTLRTMGAYAATAPYNCPKSAQILEEGLEYIMTSETAGRYSFGTIGLLAGNDPANPNNAARRARAQTEAHALIPTAAVREQMMSDVRDTASTWQRGHTLIVLAEYFLVTGDAQVLPAIEAYAVNIARNQSLFGTVGHIYAEKNPDGSDNGPMGGVYGTVNSTGLPCFLGLLLAKQCGLTNPEIDPAIERTSRFFASYAGLGAIPYGEHDPYWQGHENNGKSGLAAVAFALQDNRAEEQGFFAKMCTASASERENGHTGAFFNYLWAPLGAATGSEEAAASLFSRLRSYYDLARRWDGGFEYDCLNEGPNSGSQYNDFRMSTAILLTYALPLRQLHLTGRGHDEARWLSTTDVAEAEAVDGYLASSRTINELVSDLGSWSPKVQRLAGNEFANRSVTAATITQITNLATDPAGTSRLGACFALGKISDSGSAAARAATLAGLLTDPDNHVRYMAAESMRYLPQSAKLGELNAILAAAASTGAPLLPYNEEDPLHFAHGRLASLLFYSGNAYGPKGCIWGSGINGVDRNHLYPAIRAVAANPVGFARSTLNQTYKNLTLADVEALADTIVDSVHYRAPADKMFSGGIRQGGLDILQAYDIAEGVPLSMIYDKNDTRGSVTSNVLAVLGNYAGSVNTVNPDPGVAAYLNELLGGDKAAEAQAVLDAIAADTSPTVLTPFKSIQSVVADSPQLTLPANSTILRVNSFDHAKGDSIFTWRKVQGPGAVFFSGNGTTDGDESAIVIDPVPGYYIFEVTMSDPRALTEVSRTVELTLFNSDGVVPINLPPTAHPQLVTLKRGAITPVTLAGSDPEGYELVHSVLSQPSNGTLDGTAPNLLYTPATGFVGDDSFTFRVIDSGGEVSEATVSLMILDTSPAIVLHEPFDYVAGNISGGNGGIGFGGAWSNTRNNPMIDAGSRSWGILPTVGNHVRGAAWSGLVRPLGNSLGDAGLMQNGATLWFGVVFDLEAQNFTNADLNLALGTHAFVNNDYGTRQNLAGGEGIGVTHSGGTIQGAYWKQNDGDPQAGRVVNNSKTVMTTVNFRALVVGKIEWGAGDADPEKLTLYTPDESLSSGAPAMLTWTIPALDQSQFDTLALQFKDTPKMDEIRFGRTFHDVVTGLTDTPPVAHPQSLALVQDSPAAIDLTGETPGGGPPVFAVTRQPSHGTLSGTVPNLTYTPQPGFDGDDRFVFSVTDAADFVDEAMVTITVQPPPDDYETWAASWPEADLGDPQADHDGDGLTNHEERIWGLDPTNGASSQPIRTSLDSATLMFSYSRRSPDRTGINYTIWTSTDLRTWSEDTGAVQTPGTAGSDQVETVDVTLSVTPPEGGRLFVRVQAE